VGSEEVPPWVVDVATRPGVESPIPDQELAIIAGRALFQAGAPSPASLTLILSDDEELAELNIKHMGHEGPTDVLSFPLLPPSAFPDHIGKPADDGERPVEPPYQKPDLQVPHLGDIIVSMERARAQARGSVEDELRQLVVHGALHICGWDHAEPAERDAMRALESKVLAS
jgi:probable rRNA maturation factor